MVTWFTTWQKGKHLVKEYIMYNFSLTTLVLPKPSSTIIFNYMPPGFKYILLFIYSWEMEGSLTSLAYMHSTFFSLLFIRTVVDIIFYHFVIIIILPLASNCYGNCGVREGLTTHVTLYKIYCVCRLWAPHRTSKTSICIWISLSISELPTLNFICSPWNNWESFKINEPIVCNT